MMPPHLHYCEPYFGGGSVLLAKDPEGISEVVNDINYDLVNFWSVLQGLDSFAKFKRLCEATPFAEFAWDRANMTMEEFPVPDFDYASTREVRAWDFFIWCRQSLAGRMDSFAPLSKTRTRRGMNEQASAWLTAVEGLPSVHKRLIRVVILNRPALEAIRTQDGSDTLFYCDPPYLPETRSSPKVYSNEMSVDDHEELLDVLIKVQGKVMLSGYASDLYDTKLKNWNRHTFDLPNNAAGGETKKRMEEVIWFNFKKGNK